MDITILIPVFNEEENLINLKKTFENYAKISSKSFTVLFINDGSGDSSLKTIEEFCQSSTLFNFISFDKNYGLSSALKAGIDYATTPWIGYIDSDLQTTPEDFELFYPYMDTYDLITGVRSNRKDSFVKNFSSKFANKFRRLFTNDGMDDTGCPLKIIKTDMAKKIPMFNGLHRFLPAMILLQEGKIIQVPVRHFSRTAGISKFSTWNRLLGPLQDCFAYLWMKKKYINYTVNKHHLG